MLGWWLLLLLTAWPGPAPAEDYVAPDRPPEPEVVFHFIGNRDLTEERLRTAAAVDLRLFTRHRRPTAIDDAAYLMQLAYRRTGYHFAEVAYELHETPNALAVTRVDFLISEGARVLLGDSGFAGNTVFSNRELRELLENIMRGEGTGPPPFIEARLNEATSRIRELYLNEGYRGVQIEVGEVLFLPANRETRTLANGALLATVTINIDEGERWLIAGIELDRSPPDPATAEIDRALAAAKDELLDRPYFTRRKLVLRSHLLEAFHATGYPEARVQIHDQTGDVPGEIFLLAETASGPRVIIEEVEISGNRRTRDSFINRRLLLSPGELYNERHRRESFQELYRSGLFNRIDFELLPMDEEESAPVLIPTDPAAPPDPATTTVRRRLLVEVDEADSRELFLAGGWGSYEMLRLRAGFVNRNLFGHGRILRLETGASMKGTEVETGITDPWFLESRVQADFPIFYRVREEPSFTRTEKGLGLLFSRELTRDRTASVGYQVRRSDISQIKADTDTESLERGYGIASLKFQLSRDTRNDIFFPTAGHRTYGAVETADKVLGSELEFFRFTAGWRKFRPVSPTLTLGARVDSGLIIPSRDQVTIPLGERFYSGGENSVRSFREGRLGPKDLKGRPVGGMGFNTLSLELRRRLTDKLALSVFADYGNISPNRSRAEEDEEAFTSGSEVIDATLDDFFSDFRPGLGAGLQYLLPVGPARLDVAFNPDRQDDRHETTYVIHFSLGMAF
ncbi:BamA/OMP85 family outer membrane protein [Desulfurivibrio dismutans]|uniref:BamA/OMP85 family outer membrane protein n=1 Tax=Desulfurivibrio dismutans TaxID=1398908 RepID=UPI0023DBCDC3|nr:BamA/TamA family outer membrane protein [Desulfurivibrio alkaliphilus]MDF1613877.1 BamA/TamA family outer membrane protein [Desulfurivibrio alkaliphilus]